ncbi:MAG: hypothetical protein F6K14_02200 [Symploca sp. SIO2C1]|nr:hypothetical protein [Symploca sp. SIO2C1]
MKIRSVLAIISVAFLLFVSITAPCYAARIYNRVDFPIQARANFSSPTHFADIEPGARSESLEWTSAATDVGVFKRDNQVYCRLNTFPNNQIQGGNYMLVEPSNNCFICDSEGNLLAGQGDCNL